MRRQPPTFFVAKWSCGRKRGKGALIRTANGTPSWRLARPTATVHPDRHCGGGRRAAAVEHAERLVAVARASARPARPEELALVRVARLVHLEPLPHTRAVRREVSRTALRASCRHTTATASTTPVRQVRRAAAPAHRRKEVGLKPLLLLGHGAMPLTRRPSADQFAKPLGSAGPAPQVHGSLFLGRGVVRRGRCIFIRFF